MESWRKPLAEKAVAECFSQDSSYYVHELNAFDQAFKRIKDLNEKHPELFTDDE